MKLDELEDEEHGKVLMELLRERYFVPVCDLDSISGPTAKVKNERRSARQLRR